MRKVIQLNNHNVALCDDGSMWWLKEKVLIGENGNPIIDDNGLVKYTTFWIPIDNIPQHEEQEVTQKYLSFYLTKPI